MGFATFTLKLNKDQFNAMAAKLKDSGYGPDALEAGTLPETSGVVLSYKVARVMDAAIVTFTVEKKPMLVPVALIQSRVKGMIGVA
jgi:hypothetical protein